MFRCRRTSASSAVSSTMLVSCLSTACSWLLCRLSAAAALLLSLAGSCRACHLVQGRYVPARLIRFVFCRWVTDLCTRVTARLPRCLRGPCAARVDLFATGGALRRWRSVAGPRLLCALICSSGAWLGPFSPCLQRPAAVSLLAALTANHKELCMTAQLHYALGTMLGVVETVSFVDLTTAC